MTKLLVLERLTQGVPLDKISKCRASKTKRGSRKKIIILNHEKELICDQFAIISGQDGILRLNIKFGSRSFLFRSIFASDYESTFLIFFVVHF